jgi:hypothetical protein
VLVKTLEGDGIVVRMTVGVLLGIGVIEGVPVGVLVTGDGVPMGHSCWVKLS